MWPNRMSLLISMETVLLIVVPLIFAGFPAKANLLEDMMHPLGISKIA